MFRSTRLVTGCATMLLMIGFANESQGTIIAPTSVTATSSLDAGRDIGHTINGQGLTGGGDLLTQIHDITSHNGSAGANGTYWLGSTNQTQVLTFALPSASDVGAVHVWQYDRGHSSWDNRALSSFDISFSSDGVTFSDTESLSGLLGGNSFANTDGVQTLQFAPRSGVTHVQLTNLNNHGDGGFYGLAEIRFDTEGLAVEGVPEPASLILAIFSTIGLAVCCCWRRRRSLRRCV